MRELKRTTDFCRHSVIRENRADGTILLRSAYPLGPVADRTGDWLHRWAGESPDTVFLAERSGTGWREVRYGECLDMVRAIAAALLARGLTAEMPILILSGNGVDHGLLSLGAQYAGIPTVPVAEQYSLIPAAHPRLVEAIALVRPALAFVDDADRYAGALALDAMQEVSVVASRPGGSRAAPFADLMRGDAGIDLDAAHAGVGPDTVAKILMTSGSTSAPKGVLTTQRMMCANQAQLAGGLPALTRRRPRIMDWLPWNHVFGGSHNFNMMLSLGGSLYIDDGKPAPGLFDRTLKNLGLVTGTLHFNVPVGFSMLLGALRGDRALRQRFFEDLDLIFYAGASLPQDVWEAFEDMAMEVRGEVPLITASWGMTETAPSTLLQMEPTETSGVVGVPLAGVTVKLVPDGDGRCEIRVRGPNVTPGYFEAPDKTAEAFDAEGFLITNDAMIFVDPGDADRGMRFDGRMSENFKLSSGTWVRAAAIRGELLSLLRPLAADIVVTGQDRDAIGAMIFPDRGALTAAAYAADAEGGVLTDRALRAEIARRLTERAADGSTSSTFVACAIVLDEPPSLPDGEITAKGNLNFRKVLSRRAALVARLYDDADPSVALARRTSPKADP